MITGVRAFDEARAAFEPLHAEAYVYAPHRTGIAHHFYKPSPQRSARKYGLHLSELGSDLWREQLAFRDALRNDPTLVAEYEALKLRLAEEEPDDFAAYTNGKRDVSTAVLGDRGIRLGRR
jgi:GrpB-like predicted nucleotidyltransferase (UPF0157 family)